MLAAGLLAKKAVDAGLKVKPYVKTSLAPGSRVVTDYLEQAGPDGPLEKLGFNLVGYGCTTCIGNSGPLPEPVAKAVNEGNLVAAAVLSGNRNFEGRINPLVKANYLASPPLVVAYALAGTTDIDLAHEPLGNGSDGQAVYLRDIWPTQRRKWPTDRGLGGRARDVPQANTPNVRDSNPRNGRRFPEQASELYRLGCRQHVHPGAAVLVRSVPPSPGPIEPIHGARVLAAVRRFGHDRPHLAGRLDRGRVPPESFLQEHGVKPVDFNSYGSRRGNDRVMTRGTFANIRIHNLLGPGH